MIAGTTPNTVYTATLGSSDAFVAKWDPSKTLIYSTYLNNNRNDTKNTITVDPTRNIYMTNTTNSVNFPISNTLQPTFTKNSNIVTNTFVTKIHPSAASF